MISTMDDPTTGPSIAFYNELNYSTNMSSNSDFV